MNTTTTHAAAEATPMDDMEHCARELAQARGQLETDVTAANEALVLVHAQHADRLRAAAKRVADLEDELLGYVEKTPELFDKPQSVEFDGVRFGWRKGKGTLELPRAATLAMKKLIGRIRMRLTRAQQAAVLKIEVKVLKGPLGKLDGDTLKKLGVKITGDELKPFVTYPESDFEKAVKWWSKPLAVGAEEE